MPRLAGHASVDTRSPRQIERALTITVLSGGPSTEREVSLKSGRAVAAALESVGHHVQVADISTERLEALDLPADMVFIALHGTFGEDGQLQRILEERGITYCGSGSAASALAMDKVATKCRFVEAEVPTPRFDVVVPERVERVLENWTAPAVIKPVTEGSSVGCCIVRDTSSLRSVLTETVARYGRCMVEQCVTGPELTVGILGERSLPPIQIRTKREFYNYEAKYIDDDTEYLFDIDLPLAVLEEIGRLSVKAHLSLGCRDFSRVDWMVDEVTHRPYALEVNTIPGFTDHSLLPKGAARAGFNFAALCQRIVEMAMSRSTAG